MKTPKRKFTDFYQCPKCGAYVLSKNNPLDTVVQTACPECGTKVFVLQKEDFHAFTARCIRKNREARLRNKISVLQQRMQFAETCIPDLIEELEKYQRESERAVTSKAVAAIVAGKLFLAPCWRAKKNHDIEGS